jgi:hypothetical protein
VKQLVNDYTTPFPSHFPSHFPKVVSYNASSFSNGKGGYEVSDFINSCPRTIECA